MVYERDLIHLLENIYDISNTLNALTEENEEQIILLREIRDRLLAEYLELREYLINQGK